MCNTILCDLISNSKYAELALPPSKRPYCSILENMENMKTTKEWNRDHEGCGDGPFFPEQFACSKEKHSSGVISCDANYYHICMIYVYSVLLQLTNNNSYYIINIINYGINMQYVIITLVSS